jgi:hypothetical protein
MLVKSIEVPDVDATAVPAVNGKCVPVAEPMVAVNVPATAGTVIVPEPEVSPVRTTEAILFP